MQKLILCFALVALVVSPTAVAAADSKPNILFFLTDDQRYDAFGAAGHPVIKTPNMDRLARQGVYFRNAFVTTSICAASRASLLTGLYERTHKFTFGTPPISAKHCRTSYPYLLRMAGYRTGFIGKFGVGVAAGMKGKMFDFFKPLNRNPYFRKDADGNRRHIAEIAGDHAVQFLRSCKKSQPFCLSISFNSPHAEDSDKKDHYPYPKATSDLYTKGKMPEPRLSDPSIFEAQPKFLKKSLNRQRYFWRWDTAEKYDRNLRAYFRMISGVDRVMGRVLEEVKKLGFEDNTVVIFAADNGYYLANRGFAGKWSHYEESLRVPLVIYDPRQPKSKRGRTVDALTLNIDVPATIVDLAGREVPEVYQGRSLVPYLAGKKPDAWRTEFLVEHLMRHPRIPKWEGVRGSRYVYARYFEEEPSYEFLHDLKADPDQLKNLAKDPAYADILAKMRKRTDALRGQYGGPYSKERFPARGR